MIAELIIKLEDGLVVSALVAIPVMVLCFIAAFWLTTKLLEKLFGRP